MWPVVTWSQTLDHIVRLLCVLGLIPGGARPDERARCAERHPQTQWLKTITVTSPDSTVGNLDSQAWDYSRAPSHLLRGGSRRPHPLPAGGAGCSLGCVGAPARGLSCPLISTRVLAAW